MKIAQLVPPWIAVPPTGYGGTERIASYVTEGLVAKGHDVTLFASGDSKTAATLVPTVPKAVGNDGDLKNNPLLQMLSLSECFERAGEFDIIHNHSGQIALFMGELVKTPTVNTLHGTITKGEIQHEKSLALQKFKHQNYVSISNDQRKGFPELNFVATVYNGIPIEKYAFNPTGGDYLVWLGRITPKKGLAEGIEVAKRLHKLLHISAFVDAVDKPYFDAEIKSKIDGNFVHFKTEIIGSEKSDLLGGARVFLFPISWHEPFGMVMTEAMACGTPVVAYGRGSVPEILVDGVNGYIVNGSEEDKSGDWIIKKTGIDGLCEAVERIYAMPEEEYRKMRLACRKHSEDHFTVEKMVEGYETVYKKILGLI